MISDSQEAKDNKNVYKMAHALNSIHLGFIAHSKSYVI